jgi:hypothetical protein
MVYTRRGGFDHQVRNDWRKAGQRIDFEYVGLEIIVDVQAEIHAGNVQRARDAENRRRQPV